MLKRNIPVEKHSVSIAVAVVANLAATLLNFAIQALGFSEVNIVVVYILATLVVSLYTRGYLYGVGTAVVSTLSFNFFFSDPVFSFNVYDTAYMFTFAVMLFAALVTSALTTRLLGLTRLSRQREREAQALYAVASLLGKAGGVEGVCRVALKTLGSYIEAEVLCVLYQPGEQAARLYTAPYPQQDVAVTSLGEDEVADVLKGRYLQPVRLENRVLAVFGLPAAEETGPRRALVDSIMMQVASALEREALTAEAGKAKAEAQNERFKSSLLRAISHDLRTPLTAIAGNAEMLLHALPEGESRELAGGIYTDVDWLTRLVENILNLTRIQENRLEVHLQPEAVDEVISSAVQRVARLTPGRSIRAEAPGEVLFVPMDARLIQQVLINLLDNAARHTPPEGDILVSAKKERGRVWFSVCDSGTGIAEEDLPHLFDMFFTTPGASGDTKRGIGLGLAICRAIVGYHGGEIYAENNPGGGATFSFYLPLEGKQ